MNQQNDNTAQPGYGFAFACWTRLQYRGEWDWVTAHMRVRRFAQFAELQR